MKFLHRLLQLFKELNLNMVVAFCALIVSACALYISVQEVRIMRSQQKAAMFPYLTVGKSYNADGFGLRLENTGNGLAKIHSYQVFNDSVFFKDWFDVIRTYAPETKDINWNIMSSDGYLRNQMITPQEEKTLIFVRWTPESRLLERRLGDLKVRICYSSLLDEHWFLDGVEPKLMDGPCKMVVEKEFGL